jgi:cell division protein FtsL
MNNVSNLVQKYRQAPWRFQRQWLGLILLGVVLIAMVAGVYLNVTARAALAGREVQMLEEQITHDQLTNADLETQLAGQTSTAAMEQRAMALGFQPVNPEEIVYIFVLGYVPPADIDLSSSGTQLATSVIRPEYTLSLFDWFVERILASTPATGGQP